MKNQSTHLEECFFQFSYIYVQDTAIICHLGGEEELLEEQLRCVKGWCT